MTDHRRDCGCNFDDACTCPMSVRQPQRPAVDVLDEARRLISADRQREHGDFDDNCDRTADLCAILGIDVEAADVPLILVALKLARLAQNRSRRDNYVDAIGYLALAAEQVSA